MNRENVQALIAHLKALTPESPVQFDIHTWADNPKWEKDELGRFEGNPSWECGTVACLRGHATLLAGGTPADARWSWLACRWLGVDDVADEVHLFEPQCATAHSRTATVEQAIETLEKWLATGKIDWSHVP